MQSLRSSVAVSSKHQLLNVEEFAGGLKSLIEGYTITNSSASNVGQPNLC